MTDRTQEIVFTAAALACALAGSVPDLRERRIPNLLTGPALLFALLLHLGIGGWGQLATSALAGLLAGGILFVFFVAGGMGAGDVKLMAAVGCFVGLHLVGFLLLATAVSGAIFGLALALRGGRLRQTFINAFTLMRHHGQKGLAPHSDLNVSNAATLRMPFALPIAAGCLLTVGTQIWGV